MHVGVYSLVLRCMNMLKNAEKTHTKTCLVCGRQSLSEHMHLQSEGFPGVEKHVSSLSDLPASKIAG